MTKILFALLIFTSVASAQPATVKMKPKKKVITNGVTTPAPQYTAPNSYSNSAAVGSTPVAAAPSPAAAAAAAPAEKKSPWRLSYLVEYQGPALGNLDFEKTQTPGSPADYTEIDHYIKLGYGISPNVNIGAQFRPFTPLDPKKSFGFYDQRLYIGWNHMMETQELGIAGKATVELPTTDSSRTAGKIVAFKVEFNFEVKTPLRNWSFTADTLLKTTFYNDPVAGGAGKTDLVAAIYPYITVDLAPNTQLLFEASFDAAHNYTAAFYEYKPGDPDFVDVGPLFTLNSHMNTNIALRFFTDEISFKAAALYANLGISL